MIGFERRLQRALLERGVGELTISGVEFYPELGGMVEIAATFEDGVRERLFAYDPSLVRFSDQELVGLSRQDALQLKDRKTDRAMGLEA